MRKWLVLSFVFIFAAGLLSAADMSYAAGRHRHKKAVHKVKVVHHAKLARKKLKTLPKVSPPPCPPPSQGEGGAERRAGGLPPPAEEKAPAAGLARVKDIRHWSNEGFTRVVLDLDGDVTYKARRIKAPDRLFFDVKKAGIGSPLKDGPIEINDGILKSVRASQYDAETVRMVLDLESIKSYRALMLKDPPRLVIDVTGKESPARTEGKGVKVFSLEPDKKPAAASRSKPPEGAASKKPLSLAQQMGLCVGVIVIDPGHGGKDSGAVGPGGLMEKDVVLDVGLRLRDILRKELGCKVVMTRDDDTFIDLDARPGTAVEQDADLFISIHANASPNKTATGIETYLLNLTKDRNIMEVAARENMTTLKNMGDLDVILKDLILDNKRDESLRLAHAVQANLVSDLRKKNKHASDKGVKQGPFLVLYGASMPSILTEVGFISNPDEEDLLDDPDYRQSIAEAVFDGIREYVNTTKVASYSGAK